MSSSRHADHFYARVKGKFFSKTFCPGRFAARFGLVRTCTRSWEPSSQTPHNQVWRAQMPRRITVSCGHGGVQGRNTQHTQHEQNSQNVSIGALLFRPFGWWGRVN